VKRLKIGIDMDQVLNNLNKKWFKTYNEKYNDNLTMEDVTAWNMLNFVKPECGRDIFKILATPGFFRDLEIQPNAQEVVEWLCKYYDVYVVSAAHYANTGDKGLWLKEFFPFIKYENIIFCNDKSLIRMDYLIDDAPHNLIDFTGKKLLFDSHHNQGEDRFPRMKGWLDVAKYFVDKHTLEDLRSDSM